MKSLTERVGALGEFRWELRDAATGRLKMQGDWHNLIVRLGLAAWCNAIFVTPSSLVTQCAVGTGTTAPATTDTALTTELEVNAFFSTSDSGLTGDTPYKEIVILFLGPEAIGNLTEWGLKHANNNLFNHARFGSGVITGATQADPVVITDADHGLTDGTRILISSVGGMTQLNGNRYYAKSLSSSTFSLYNDEALTDTLDGSGFSAYTSGGIWIVDIPKTSADTLTITARIRLQNP